MSCWQGPVGFVRTNLYKCYETVKRLPGLVTASPEIAESEDFLYTKENDCI